MGFNELIKEGRITKKLKQTDIAQHFGFTEQFVSNMEAGKAYPPASCFNKYMKKIGLAPMAMFVIMLEERLAKHQKQIEKSYGVNL